MPLLRTFSVPVYVYARENRVRIVQNICRRLFTCLNIDMIILFAFFFLNKYLYLSILKRYLYFTSELFAQ